MRGTFIAWLTSNYFSYLNKPQKLFKSRSDRPVAAIFTNELSSKLNTNSGYIATSVSGDKTLVSYMWGLDDLFREISCVSRVYIGDLGLSVGVWVDIPLGK